MKIPTQEMGKPISSYPQAKAGDVIEFKYYGAPATGTVRKKLENSVIVGHIDCPNKTPNKTYYDETVISHRHYTIIKEAQEEVQEEVQEDE